MKIAISVPDDLSRAADRAAKRMKIPRSRFYARAVETYLGENYRLDVTERLNAVYGSSANQPDPVFSEQGLETLRRAEWKE